MVINKKVIVVNATALTSGGALTILKQFIDGVENNDKINSYIVFSGNSSISSKADNVIIYNQK